MFRNVAPYSGDPILDLMERYKSDRRPHKANLGIGIYHDSHGRIPVLSTVRTAEMRRVALNVPRTYLPMEGDAGFRKATKDLLFGPLSDVQNANLAVVQTVGGSGALKVGADFLKLHFPSSDVWVPDPTWDNHIGIFQGAGFIVRQYPYLDRKAMALNFSCLADQLNRLPAQSIVLLHPCCHNPTGIDPNRRQWEGILEVVQRRGLLPFFDVAYQGFSSSLQDDVWPVRESTRRGIPFFVSNSFSKIFSLYGERCGALTIYSPEIEHVKNIFGQLKLTIRRNYSSPPTYGAAVISTILNDPILKGEWEQEVTNMRERIQKMRLNLHETLVAKLPDKNWEFLLRQNGMFGYTGLTAAQVSRLIERHAVYAISSGRICIAGLNELNINHVCDSIVEVIRSAGSLTIPETDLVIT
jgi:aromatic-amino-acid transaminase